MITREQKDNSFKNFLTLSQNKKENYLEPYTSKTSYKDTNKKLRIIEWVNCGYSRPFFQNKQKIGFVQLSAPISVGHDSFNGRIFNFLPTVISTGKKKKKKKILFYSLLIF